MTRRPGKFEGCADHDLGEQLYELSMDGGLDDELGDVADFGWFGLIVERPGDGDAITGNWIVSEDSQGFFDYEEFATPEDARRQWAKIEAEYAQFTEDSEDN